MVAHVRNNISSHPLSSFVVSCHGIIGIPYHFISIKFILAGHDVFSSISKGDFHSCSNVSVIHVVMHVQSTTFASCNESLVFVFDMWELLLRNNNQFTYYFYHYVTGGIRLPFGHGNPSFLSDSATVQFRDLFASPTLNPSFSR